MTLLIQQKILKEALLLFSNTEQGVFWRGKFASLSTDLQYTAQKQVEFQPTANLVKFIVNDIWNISTIIHRLSWFRNSPIDTEFRDQMWFSYARIDIEHFHTELRSIMDYAGEFISNIAIKRGQVPKKFTRLQNYVSTNDANRARIGEELSLIIESANWFPSFRGIRNALIHTGGNALIFDVSGEEILFQVYGNDLKDLIDTEIFMYNENVVHFDRYAAFYLASLFVFLEKLANYIYEKHNIKTIGINGSRISSPGFHIIHKWVCNLKELIDK